MWYSLLKYQMSKMKIIINYKGICLFNQYKNFPYNIYYNIKFSASLATLANYKKYS